MKNINWIASFPKSGNTWARLLMDAYFLEDVDINDIQTSHGDSNARYHAIDNLPPTRFSPTIQAMLRPTALVKMVVEHENHGKATPLFLKTHVANVRFAGIDLIPRELTNSVLYLVRDPRDVVPSYAAHMGLSYDKAIDSMANEWLLLTRSDKHQVDGMVCSWGQNVRSYTNANALNTGLVKFEDLKQAPAQALTYMLKHIGIDEPDPARVKKAVEMTRLSKLKAQEDAEGFGERSDKGEQFFGKKHKPLTVKQRRRVEKVFGPEMRLLGYL